jgi:hydrogenase maturation protease
MTRPRILVACVGNIFMGDDAFGVEVAGRLAGRGFPDEVRVVDFGIRGFDLTWALLEDYEAVILVDAVPRDGEPGTLYVIEPEKIEQAELPAADLLTTHGMDPAKVLRLARALGSPVRKILVVGCEPKMPSGDDIHMAMSEPVRRAVDDAVPLIESLLAKLLAEKADSHGT